MTYIYIYMYMYILVYTILVYTVYIHIYCIKTYTVCIHIYCQYSQYIYSTYIYIHLYMYILCIYIYTCIYVCGNTRPVTCGSKPCLSQSPAGVSPRNSSNAAGPLASCLPSLPNKSQTAIQKAKAVQEAEVRAELESKYIAYGS